MSLYSLSSKLISLGLIAEKSKVSLEVNKFPVAVIKQKKKKRNNVTHWHNDYWIQM